MSSPEFPKATRPVQRAFLSLSPVVIASTTDAAWNERLAVDSVVRDHSHRMRVPEPSDRRDGRDPGGAPVAAGAGLRLQDRRQRPARGRDAGETLRGRRHAARIRAGRAAPGRRAAQAGGAVVRRLPPRPPARLRAGRRRRGGGGQRDDRDPGEQAGRGRARPLRPHGRGAAPAHHRPGRRGAGGQPGGEDRPRRAEGSEAAHRLVPLPRPDRRGQDRAGEGAGRVHVRQRGRHGRARHERISAGSHRQPADRRAARLRGLRGGRPAHRQGPPAAQHRRAVRRGRKGAPAHPRYLAPDHGRGPADRLAGPDRVVQRER